MLENNGFTYAISKDFCCSEMIYLDRSIDLHNAIKQQLHTNYLNGQILKYTGKYNNDRESDIFSSEKFSLYLNKIKQLFDLCIIADRKRDTQIVSEYISSLDNECLIEFLCRSEEDMAFNSENEQKRYVAKNDYIKINPSRIEEVINQAINYSEEATIEPKKHMKI